MEKNWSNWMQIFSAKSTTICSQICIQSEICTQCKFEFALRFALRCEICIQYLALQGTSFWVKIWAYGMSMGLFGLQQAELKHI